MLNRIEKNKKKPKTGLQLSRSIYNKLSVLDILHADTKELKTSLEYT